MIPRVNACFPALSPELWFLLCHAEESEEIYKNPEKHLGQLHPALPQAFRKVYEKAYEDLQELIKLVTRTVSRRTQGLAIIDWKFQTVSEDWGVWGYLRRSNGRTDHSAWAGIYLDCVGGSPRIHLVISPPGGGGGRRYLAEECRKNRAWGKRLELTEDAPDLWPGWDAHPCLVVYVRRVSKRAFMNHVVDEIAQTTTEFLKIAMPILAKMR